MPRVEMPLAPQIQSKEGGIILYVLSHSSRCMRHAYATIPLYTLDVNPFVREGRLDNDSYLPTTYDLVPHIP